MNVFLCGFHYFQPPPPPGYVQTSSSNKGIQGLLDKAGAMITGGVLGSVSILHDPRYLPLCAGASVFLSYFILLYQTLLHVTATGMS